MRTKDDKLTKKQKAVLDYIVETIRTDGIAPTVRDICVGLNLSSPSTVHVHLKTLEDKGFIYRDPLKSRCIKVLKTSEDQLTADELPVPQSNMLLNDEAESSPDVAPLSPRESGIIELPVVGDVAAGTPILAEQNITDTIKLPTSIVGDSSSFLLNVHGCSMIEIGINDGDYVVVKEQQVAENGDIVVAIVDDGATVKRFFKEQDHIRLQPENHTMEPIIVENAQIAGKVVAVFRRL